MRDDLHPVPDAVPDDSSVPAPVRTDRAVGAVLASACGDALGAGYEFGPPLGRDVEVAMIGGGAFGWEPGEFTDDTQMAVAVLDALARPSSDVVGDVEGGFLAWFASGPADVGTQTRAVLSSGSPLAEVAMGIAVEHPDRSGNGSLMRTGPVALAHPDDPEAVADLARRVSALTHASADCLNACVLWSVAIDHAIHHAPASDVDHDWASGLRAGLALLPEGRRAIWAERIDAAVGAAPVSFEHNGWVVHAFQAALAAITSTPVPDDDPGDHLRLALDAAVRAGGDTDTVAAIAGSLLGARWGATAVPPAWRRLVHGVRTNDDAGPLDADDLDRLARLAFAGGRRDAPPAEDEAPGHGAGTRRRLPSPDRSAASGRGQMAERDPIEPDIDVEDDEQAATEAVERDRSELKAFVAQLSGDDIRSGTWFTKLLAQALGTYTRKVDWKYFQEKYAGVPADAIVDQRIKMAARYAAIEGGLSASAYTATVAATIGSLGGASPATVPAAATAVLVDVTFISQLQIRLAYDISVLYRVPIDTDDPDDLWKLIQVAFTIKSGEAARQGVLKIVPVAVRPLIKSVYTGSTRLAFQSLPVIGKHLLVRNVIKVGIPLVGVPLAVVVNRYTTLVSGRHARAVFRNEARVVEAAEKLLDASANTQLCLWVAWLVILADGKISDDEALLMRHLVRLAREVHDVADERLARVIELDPNDVWQLLDAETGDVSGLVDLAQRVAEIDGAISAKERRVIDELRGRCVRA